MTNLMPSPAVSLVGGRPTVTSMQVAEYFGKNHNHVLRDIRRIIDECEGVSNFGQTPIFEETTYADGQNGQAYPMFIIYRDGFMLLAMGYTGKKALQIKLVFIAAFNAMETELTRRVEQPALESTATPSTADERAPLRALVNAWAQTSSIAHQALWPQVKAHFQLARIDDLPKEWIPDALAFVQGKIDTLALAQPKQLALPPASTDPDELERRFSVIKGYLRAIADEEREIFRIVKDGMRPALLAVSTPRRSIAIQSHTAMERLFYSLDYGLEAAEATIRSALIASRM